MRWTHAASRVPFIQARMALFITWPRVSITCVRSGTSSSPTAASMIYSYVARTELRLSLSAAGSA